MSSKLSFANAKQALRRGTFALATVASMVATNAAHAGEFTQRDCGKILSTSSTVIGVLDARTLSPILPETLANFIAPSSPQAVHKIIVDGNFRELAKSQRDEDMALKRAVIPTLTCDGPTEIVTPTGPDVVAFNTIRDLVASGANPVDLQARGLRSVAGPVAALSLTAN